jgi:hypothetical protein
VCYIFVYLQFWCVNLLEQILAGTPLHFYHGQVKAGVRGSCEAWNGVFRKHVELNTERNKEYIISISGWTFN